MSAERSKRIACAKNFFLSFCIPSRRLILEGLIRSRKARKLHFYGYLANFAVWDALDTILKPMYKIDWVAYAKESFAGPKAMLASLSRETHGATISNSRLIHLVDKGILFGVKDCNLKGAGRHTTMTLATLKFIYRLLIHVLPRGQYRVRHYGFFCNGTRAVDIARITATAIEAFAPSMEIFRYGRDCAA